LFACGAALKFGSEDPGQRRELPLVGPVIMAQREATVLPCLS
jgi:hypothetical protein